MAEQQSNETIRQMLSGFSAMQFNLGLLPMQQAQSMAGVASPYQAPPPPPRVPHPSEAALNAMAQQQNMMQQTLQAAQMTRYTPPPSAPTPAMASMTAFSGGFGGGFGGGGYGGGPAPFISPLGGGGGGFGGGAPSLVYGSGGGGAGHSVAPFAPRLPSIFNPFAPTLPAAHFASPAMRNLQLMQHAQAQTMGTIAGVGEAALGIGGSVIGGALGGPIGSYIGGKIGSVVGGMAFGPVTQDFARGRKIQQMTSPYMVSGPHLNMMTGQGMDAQASRQVATGIRHLALDREFERTGFNTQDAMRIMQTSASVGLMTGVNTPDQMVQKVKDLSKTVKMIMRITGDPDVQDAIRSLGQMRDLGFQGLASQAGAVANRMTFARMAGQSQEQMTRTMMAGADMAGQFGLVGATGAMAGGFGAAAANVAASSGAVNDLQLARAGGREGLGQLNARASLASMANEQALLASLGRGPGGRMQVDVDAYRRFGQLSFQEQQQHAAEALRNMGAQGIFEWNTHRNEFKDQIAQKLRPGEMQMMMLQNARAFQAGVPGMDLGTAIQKTTGLSADEAGIMQRQLTSRKYWQGMANQLSVQRRDVEDQERAQREEYRTPGLLSRFGHHMRGEFANIGEFVSTPFRAASEHFERMHEERDAHERGERINRYADVDIAHDAAERQGVLEGLKSPVLDRAYTGGGIDRIGTKDPGRTFIGMGGLAGPLGLLPDALGGGAVRRSTARNVNRITSMFGLTEDSASNRYSALADYAEGRYTSFGETFHGMSDEANQKIIQGRISVAHSIEDAARLKPDAMAKTSRSVSAALGGGVNADAILSMATKNMLSKINDKTANWAGKSAGSMSEDDMKDSFVEAAKQSGLTDESKIEAAWQAQKKGIMASMSGDVMATGTKEQKEVMVKAQEVATRAGAFDLLGDRQAVKDDIKKKLNMAGLAGVDDETLGKIKSVIYHHDASTVALASALRGVNSSNKAEAEGAQRVIASLSAREGPEKFNRMKAEANRLGASWDDKTKDALELQLRGVSGISEMEVGLTSAKAGLNERGAAAASDEFMQKLEGIQSGLSGKGSVKEAIGSLTDEALDRLEEKGGEHAALAKRLRTARDTGDTSGIDKDIVAAGPTTATTRHSGASSEKLDELDEMRAKYEKEAANAEDQGEPDDMQGKAIDLFATSVGEFARAVKDLKGHSESSLLDLFNPIKNPQD